MEKWCQKWHSSLNISKKSKSKQDSRHYVVFIKCCFFSTVTFEDKKRENFERGNLELEKRRQALQEQQRKEQERLAAIEREEQERKVNIVVILKMNYFF